MPLVKRFVEEIVGKPAERGVDPMEAVAIGAAIQGAILAGEMKNVVLLDVTPVSLGVETLGGIFTKIIERNTTIPTRRSEIFTTAEDFQTAVTIHVLQGERPMAADNVSLGMFTLDGIPPAPRGVPRIEVTFDIDANGILHVSAKDLATGKEAKITITSRVRLSEEEKRRMTEEAQKYAEEDRKKLELAQARNDADYTLYTSSKVKQELRDRLSGDDLKQIEGLENELKEAMKGNDASAIRAKTEELRKKLQEVGARAYQGAQPGGQQGTGQGEAGGKTYDVK